jgi:uncharacterized glyoxalase superfamily protein PhnB
MKKLTPVLVVEAIEPQLEFWCGRLGFQKLAEVPHGGALGFVILQHGPVELMLQSRASVLEDNPAAAERAAHVTLFVEVEDLDSIRARLAGLPLVFDGRTTFYGSRETCVHDPAGNVIVFAQFPPAVES